MKQKASQEETAGYVYLKKYNKTGMKQLPISGVKKGVNPSIRP